MLASKGQKKIKILLTENGGLQILRDAPVTAFPKKRSDVSSPYPHAGKLVSKEYRCR
jgi:hypothetical protein